MKNLVTAEVVLAAGDIERMPAQPLSSSLAAVTNTALFEAGGTFAGVLRLAPGATLPEHEHRGMAHHVLVVAGCAAAFGRSLPAGSYWFVPAGHGHTVEGVPPEGCTLFYVDVPEG